MRVGRLATSEKVKRVAEKSPTTIKRKSGASRATSTAVRFSKVFIFSRRNKYEVVISGLLELSAVSALLGIPRNRLIIGFSRLKGISIFFYNRKARRKGITS